MNTSNTDITPEESLKLIRSMIETTKHTISDTSHFYLLWGWAVLAGCLIQYTLLKVGYQHHYYAWFVTLIAVALHIYFVMRLAEKEVVRTYIGEANQFLWTSIGIAFMVLAVVFTKLGWQNSFPVYILLYGIGTYVSGNLLKFKPFIIGGIACFVISAFTAYLRFDQQMLSTAFAILISYIIPGHLLRAHYQKTKKA